MDRLAGRVAVVTGAGSGIGRGIAEGFAREGAEVVVADINAETGAETAEAINAAGGRALFCQVDVTIPRQVNKMAKEAAAYFGKIHILCNNTGAATVEPSRVIRIVDLTDSQWDDIFDLGLKSIHNCCRAIIPEIIRAGGGSVINISSIAGSAPAFSAAFSAMKAGVIAISRAIAIQYADDNIRCNSICPGAIRSPGGVAAAKKGLYAGEDRNRVRLINRFGTPEDVANAAVFLASEESSYITATNLAVDGGMLSLVSHVPPRIG